MSVVASTLDPSGCSNLSSAARWFLHSGIQESDGGVARYYLAEPGRNARVSTEITSYAISTHLYLHRLTADAAHLQAARHAGEFLAQAWDEQSSTMPFELPARLAFFFDTGIVARGLLRLWRTTGDERFRQRAERCAESMLRDFRSGREIHPILELPAKSPALRDARWSRQPGCYQLKAALAWLELGEATGRAEYRLVYDDAVRAALESHHDFLAGEGEGERAMDRLHAYLYFLEGLLPKAREHRRAFEEAIHSAAACLRRTRSILERSDACAQLLRLRLLAGIPVDEAAAEEEAAWCASYQDASDDPRRQGGFWFGSRPSGRLPFINPVSTAFCAQALAWWHQRRRGAAPPLDWHDVI